MGGGRSHQGRVHPSVFEEELAADESAPTIVIAQAQGTTDISSAVAAIEAQYPGLVNQIKAAQAQQTGAAPAGGGGGGAG